jgi:hypothetical protein
MITASNYFEEVERIGVSTLPETLKKGHDLVVKSTANGTNWGNYHNSEGIKKVVDLYFQKLNEYAGQHSAKSESAEPSKPVTSTAKKESKPKEKKVKQSEKPKNVKHVEHIRAEVRFIKRYVGLHNKVRAPKTILSFIRALQRSIVQKLIRKN